MLTDRERDQVIVALADALADIAQANAVNRGRVEELARRLDRESGGTDPASSFVLTARELKLAALAHAGVAESMKRRALDALGHHVAAISDTRISVHRQGS
jgi:hypothetical protein